MERKDAMELNQKQLVKIADAIHDQLGILAANHYKIIQQQIDVINNNQKHLQTVRDGLEKCNLFNWQTAAKKMIGKANQIVQKLPGSVCELQRTIQDCQNTMPSLRDIYEELRQTHTEFGELDYDPQENTLSVFTNPIELEGVFLGDFEICLQIPQLTEMSTGKHLKIIAMNPNPAAVNDEITHPHVSEEYLCAGDASVPMQAALVNGRISDFFLLIRSVLESYNPDSPYVPLSEWDGNPCYDCGYTVCEDDSYYCESCENSFCNECMGGCYSCDTYLCNGCLSSCQACEERFCEKCLTICPECEKSYCGSCLTICSQCNELVCESCIDENLCPSCKEEMENQENEKEQIEPEAQEKEQQVA
jgi:hypothetical protein